MPCNLRAPRVISLRPRMLSLFAPAHYPRIKRVENFDQLISTPFADGINALCSERKLSGDFAELVTRLDADGGLELGITPLEPERLEEIARSPNFSAAGRIAIQAMLTDL